MHRTIISFVQPQPNSIQNKNNPIGCGTAPGNLSTGFDSLFIAHNTSIYIATLTSFSVPPFFRQTIPPVPGATSGISFISALILRPPAPACVAQSRVSIMSSLFLKTSVTTPALHPIPPLVLRTPWPTSAALPIAPSSHASLTPTTSSRTR